MKRQYRARARPLLVAALLAVGAVGSLSAQGVQFIGTTGGCFFTAAACTPTDGQDATTMGLTYNSGSFDVTEYMGVASIGGTTDDNFGSFTSVAPSSGDYNYNGTNFNLLITFTAPSAAGKLFSAVLTGQVASTGAGSLAVIFNGGTQPRQYFGATNMYSVAVDPLYNVTPGEVQYVTGETTATPEPISLVLLGSGLLGMGVVGRRRRRKN